MRLSSLLLAIGLIASAASAQVYQWVDENGRVHFSDNIPARTPTETRQRPQNDPAPAAPTAAARLSSEALPGMRWDDIAHLRHLVRARQFELLNEELDRYRHRASASYADEIMLWYAYQAFDVGVASLEDYYNDWVRLHSSNQASLLARASYRSGMAWTMVETANGKVSDEDEKRINGLLYSALTDLDAVLRINPESTVAYTLLVRMAGIMRDGEAMKLYLDHARQAVPDSFLVPRMRLLFLTPSRGGSVAAMERYAAEVASSNSGNPFLVQIRGYVNLYLGDEKRKRGDSGGALAEYSKAVAIADNHEFYQRRGDLLLTLGRYTSALDDYSHASRYNTADAMLFLGEAKAFGGLRQYRNAAAELLKARKIDPTNLAVAEYSLTVVKALVAESSSARQQGLLEDARDYVETALEVDRKHGDALYEYALVLMALQQFTEAQRQLEIAVDARADQFKHYQLMEELLARRYQWDEVIIAWTTYIERYGESPAALEARAQAYNNNRQYIEALADAEAAASLGSQSARTLAREYRGPAEEQEARRDTPTISEQESDR